MKSGDMWGPFSPGLDLTERTARLRCLATIAHMRIGPRGADLCRWLACSEIEPAFLDRAVDALARLAALDRRHILGSYLRLSMQPAPCPF